MWIVFALLAALFAATSVTLTKAGVGNIDPVLAFAIQGIFILSITWVVVLFQKNISDLGSIDKKTWLLICGAGVATTLSSIFQFKALKIGNASAVTSIDRSSLALAVFFAFIFLKENPNWKVIAGAALIVTGSIIIAISSKSA